MVLPIAAITLSLAAIIVSVVAFIRAGRPHKGIEENAKQIRINKAKISNNKKDIRENLSEISNLYEITPKAEKVGKETVLTFMGETIYITENKKR